MSELVDPARIEEIVGVPRHATLHFARAVSAEHTVYVLHSHECKQFGIDLRQCEFSRALDCGIDLRQWVEDVAVQVHIVDGRLVPLDFA